MSLRNIQLIFVRELRDQLRDRRMLFTVAILPLVLYPLMGTLLVQIAQFLRAHPTRIRLIGTADLPASPPLLEADRFHTSVCDYAERNLMPLMIEPRQPTNLGQFLAEVDSDIRRGVYDAAVFIPQGFADRLREIHYELQQQQGTEESFATAVPSPAIYYNTASDRSQVAFQRVERVLQRWRDAVVRENLRSSRLPESIAQPFRWEFNDVAEVRTRRAAQWSKILPFVMLVWALTGAFYPAVDLCAGEKERGTLETLLTSPAERSEIVWGKLLTTMVFSMTTAVLNMVSLTVTMVIFSRQLSSTITTGDLGFGWPSPSAVLWLLLALVPASAMFSGMAIALAAFARSTKEGHYYLMPLLLVMLPLMLLAMSPAFQLSLGSSLIPVAGLMALLRTLIEGQYRYAASYVFPVILITAVCCWLAVRWAVDQFCNENVLFREGERGGVRVWFRHFLQHRGDAPTVGEAVFCALLLILIRTFAMLFAARPASWDDLLRMSVIQQCAMIAFPILVATLVLTRNPARTLHLRTARWADLAAAILLAIAIHPLVLQLGGWLRVQFPLNEETRTQLESVTKMLAQSPLHWLLLALAVVPALCEETAFRGFILSGLRRMGHKWGAIVATALFFGWLHPIFHQQIVATLVGIVLGIITVQTGSLLPAILMHAAHNSLLFVVTRLDAEFLEQFPLLGWFYRVGSDGPTPTWIALAAGVLLCGIVLYYVQTHPRDEADTPT
jgi:sodium transport system permease protein